MGSKEAAGMQLSDGMHSSWTQATYEAVQDIASALQSGGDDVRPIDHAPNYQVLCGAARQACCQAELSIQSSAGQAAAILPAKELDCLCQLSTATLQLSAAICCDPAVALPLISSGTHASALEELKHAVKALTTIWTSCMQHLQQSQQQQDGVSGSAGNPAHAGSSSQHAWQGMTPSLAASVKHLLHMSVTSAEFVSSSSIGGGSIGCGSSQAVPKEMCSMSVLNLSWINLTRLLVAVPEEVRPQVLEAQDLLRGLQCALQQLHTAVMELSVQDRTRQVILVKFWLQAVSRLTSVVPEDAACQALQSLMQVTLDVFDAVVQQRQELAAVQDILQDMLQPRLLACLSTLLSTSTDVAALQNKLDALLQQQHANPAEASSHPQQQQQQQRLTAQVYLVLALLQGYLPGWPAELMAAGCKHMLCWTLSTTGQDLMLSIVGTTAAAAAAAGDGQGSMQQDGDGLGSDATAGLELMQGVLQGCLVGLMLCWGVLQDMQQQQQMELLVTVNTLALSAHPLVSFLAQQLLADLIAAASSSELASQQLGLLHKLLGASAAAAAVPGAPWDASSGTEAVLDTLAAVLQACDPAFAAEWLKQHVMPGLGSNNSGITSGTSSSSAWLDAGACALLVQESALLQRLVGMGPQLMPVSQAQLQEAWTQLWSTAQQVAELLEPQHLQYLQQPGNSNGSSNDSGTLCQQQAEILLVLHQLTWLFAAMQAVLQLFSTSASGLKQGAAELAVDVLKALSRSSCGRTNGGNSSGSNCSGHTSSQAATAAAAAVQHACLSAVLGLLAVSGQLTLTESQTQGLLAALASLAGRHEDLHVVLAGVLGSLGAAAKCGDQTFTELFQQLIQSQHWPVRHAVYEALLQLLRHGDLGSGIMGLLPPALKLSATSAAPDIIATVKAHLQKQPDTQAQACFAQQYPRLAAQHMQQLAQQAKGRPKSFAAPESLSTNLQDLQSLLAACEPAATAAQQAAGDVKMGSAEDAQHGAAAGQGPMYAVGMGGAQALLAQAATAAKSLQAADKALSIAEADVNLLLAAVSAAARDQALGAEGILLVSKQGSSLMGNVASMISRLRALQDSLSTLRQ